MSIQESSRGTSLFLYDQTYPKGADISQRPDSLTIQSQGTPISSLLARVTVGDPAKADMGKEKEAKMTSDCCYIDKVKIDSKPLHDLIERSKKSTETFESIFASFQQIKEVCPRYDFKFPLHDKAHAEIFWKVLQIKAQEANRFVPPIIGCKFISPSHLGFNRQITIQDGPLIQEHLLVDRVKKAVIFIEEWEEKPDNEGEFAALNAITVDEGRWFFTGTYFYPWHASEKEIDKSIAMFTTTFENMFKLSQEKDKVEKIHKELHDL